MENINPIDILREVWKYENFRPFQEEIIHSVLSKKDTLALLPTSGGKSLCYQLPALMQEGITLVISPLMALIKDQIQNLHQKGIKAIYLSSEQSFLGQIDVFDYVRETDCKILYVSPERLKNKVFVQSLKSLQIDLIAVDEAHCISEWGNDFRPSYLAIKEFKESIGNPTTIALTATATPKVQEEIIERLGLENTELFKDSFERKNLSIHFQETENKIQYLEHLLKKHPKTSSIIYVRTRKEAENIAKQLKNSGFSTDFFHAGIPDFQKQNKQQLWMQGSLQNLVTTNAFGMGIDKEDVGLIIHHSLPYSLENYYQEIGRAGRNNEESEVVLLYNEYDLQQVKSDFKYNAPTPSEFETILKKLFTELQIANFELPEENVQLDFFSFCQNRKLNKQKVMQCLQFLHNSGILFWNYNVTKSKLRIKLKPYQIDDYQGVESKLLESLSRSVSGVFNDFVSFDEKYWAQHFSLPQKELNQYLLKWEKQDFIAYQNGNFHTIQMIQPRDDAYIIQKLGSYFFKHLNYKAHKLKNLVDFIQEKEICRMKTILAYFGEEKIENCGKCDVCRQDNQEPLSSLSSLVLTYIETQNRSLQDILLEFQDHSPNQIIDALQELISSKKIKNLSFNTYSKI